MTNTQLLARRPCGKCKTTGQVPHIHWELLRQDIPVCTDPKKIEQWFDDHGCLDSHRTWPPKTMDCPECKGIGYIIFWIDVEEVKNEIKDESI